MPRGLLDYQPDALSQGLLGLGTALMTPRALGGGMAAGMQAFNTGALQANQLKRQAQQDALRERLLEAQMESYRAAADDRKASAEEKRAELAAALARQQGRQGVLAQLGPQPMGFRDASIAMGGTAPAGYTPPQQRQVQITPELAARYVANGGKIEDLKGIMESANFGREEVARVLEQRGADNTPESVMIDRFGRRVGGAIPKPFEMNMQDTGGSIVPVNPYAPTPLTKSMTPDGVASNAVARGNLGVAQANLGLSRERFAAEQRERASGGADRWVNDLESGRQVNMATGESRPITANGAPVGPRGAANTQQRVADATDAVDIIAEAEKYITDATGSYAGTAWDMAARFFGASTPGAQNAARLQAMEGMLVSKMPKMSGPQSDKDVLLYKQMAGQIGDTTIPPATKQAALDTIKMLQRKYAGLPPEQQGTPPPSANDLQEAARRELARRASPRGGANGSF